MPVKLLTANEQYSLLFGLSILICLNQVQLLYIHGREVVRAELGLLGILYYGCLSRVQHILPKLPLGNDAPRLCFHAARLHALPLFYSLVLLAARPKAIHVIVRRPIEVPEVIRTAQINLHFPHIVVQVLN